MKLVHTRQVPEQGISEGNWDVFIGASGYEARATHAWGKIRNLRIPRRCVLGFQDRRSGNRAENDWVFENSGVQIVPAYGDDCEQARSLIRREIEASGGDHVRVLLDYSSMTRAWYSGLLSGIEEVQGKARVEVWFSYSPAKFEDPLESPANACAGPLGDYCGLDLPEKPSALVVGLGYERYRSLGLLQYVDPAIAFASYTEPAMDERFSRTVLVNNGPMLQRLPSSHIYRHPMDDLQRTGNMLRSLCEGLCDDYRVILAPLGVKPFALLCLLLARQLSGLDVWRVSAGVKAEPQQRIALGPLLVLETIFAE